MKAYIDKSTLVKEIKKRIKETESMITNDPFWDGKISGLDSVLKILDTLKVEEVDLEKELDRYTNSAEYVYNETRDSYFLVAKYFFELGLKAQKEE